MSRKWNTVISGGACLVIATCATSAILMGRAATEPATQDSVEAPRTRNLSLQPEAVRVNRRLGNRFKSSGRPESILTGTLTVGTNQQHVTIIRRQTDIGESVELQLAGRRLTWTDAEGVKAGSEPATVPERLLLERLVFDSPDNFVLAQLRGASYFTISRNLRPDDAGDNYSGPLWTMVRVSEPQSTDDTSQSNQWRFYYINESTGLIDRITCEVNGQAVEAGIEWTERQSEQVPSHIKWTTSGQTVMELEVAAFSQSK